MSNRQLTFICPDLLPFLADHTEFKLSGLTKLLEKADVSINTYSHYEELIFDLFGFPHGVFPVAKITGALDNLPTEQDYWLRIDPVEIKTDLAGLYLFGNETLDVESWFEKEETKKILQKLTELLALDELEFFAPHARRWYLRIKKDPEIKTRLLSETLGKEITAYLPAGPNQVYWRKLLTEIQILFHGFASLSNNESINSVWLWGEGNIPKIVEAPMWSTIFTNDFLAAALGNYFNYPTHELPTLDLLQIPDGKTLIVLKNYPLSQLDENFFWPFVNALRGKQLQSLELYLGGDQVYRITSKTIRYFWRKRKIKPNEKEIDSARNN